ncbi:Crinkler (CRN) family protein [Thraustotheca clavata]|uniref:Crinkler (CRN) family protein n=1 Tax=Thraustotheca clavata TaxID=74557 RepID=A0A1V9YS18_9STRA|nr:Crinkler (CRN) family protein [Thraustotheca clavata]
MLMNLEVKLEMGDATMQNIAYYVKSLKSPLIRRMPCILIQICGPYLSVNGIINWGDEKVYCEPLVPTLPLLLIGNKVIMGMLARVCASLKVALNQLADYYNTNTNKLSQSIFPYYKTAIIDQNEFTLTYTQRIERNVFGAMTSFGPVVVKFAKQYLKFMNFAPIQDLPQSCCIMKYFQVDGYLLSWKSCNLLQSLRPQSTHNQSFVHGDLREVNIMWDTDNSRVVLIDFDWPGIHNESTYPEFMNSNIQWPPGARTNQKLLMEHDVYWVNKLFEKF